MPLLCNHHSPTQLEALANGVDTGMYSSDHNSSLMLASILHEVGDTMWDVNVKEQPSFRILVTGFVSTHAVCRCDHTHLN